MPFRGGTNAVPLEVMLVTSRETRRWIVPKGKVDPGMIPSQAAAQEALEEAGVIGEVGASPIGQFAYLKRYADGSSEWIEVDLFVLTVLAELGEWKEQHERERRWFSTTDAAKAVGEPDLSALIAKFAPL